MALLVIGEKSEGKALAPTTLEGHAYYSESGVFVRPSIDEDDMHGFEVSPVLEDVRGLGQVTLEAVRRTEDPDNSSLERIHRTYGIEIDGFKRAVDITDPVKGEAKHNIFTMPGLGERIHGPVRKKYHEKLALNHPDARIISSETDGIGNIGDHYDARDKSEREKHTHVQMALSRLAIARLIGGDRRQIVVGTSQGSVLSHRMAMENEFGEPENGPINLSGLVWVSPALVDPSRSRNVMNDRFIAKFGRDLALALMFRSTPLEAVESLMDLSALSIPGQNLGAVRHQISQLRKGTPREHVEDVVEAVPTLVIQGSNDAVGETDMYDTLGSNPKNQLTVVRIPGRGHEIAMNPAKLFRKLGKTQQYCHLFLDEIKAAA